MVAALQFFSAVAGTYTLAHEIGHLMGCQHDDINGARPPLYTGPEFGFYVDHPGKQVMHTIMAWVLGYVSNK